MLVRNRPNTIAGLLLRLAAVWLNRLGSRRRRQVVAASVGGSAILGVMLMSHHERREPPRFDLPQGAALCDYDRGARADEFGVVWAIEERPYQGIDLYFGRFSPDGKRIGSPVSVGWGYHAESSCGVAADDLGYTVVWPHWDDMDNDAELHFTRFGHDGARLTRRQLDYSKLGSHIVDQLEATDRGFTVRFHMFFDESPRVLKLDREGRVIPQVD